MCNTEYPPLNKETPHQPSYWAVIPAAGLGSRMGMTVPKQYLRLHDKTVLEHSLHVLVNSPKIKKVAVALHAEDQYWSSLIGEQSEKLITTVGGKNRIHSVLQGLQCLHSCAHPDDWVIVHDAARPCLRSQDLDFLMTKLYEHPVGGLLGMPVTDTLKQIDKKNRVKKTVPREQLWVAQTPQMFRFSSLRKAIQEALQAEYLATDESSAIERMGLSPMMVEGGRHNIKITYPEDLLIAEKILGRPDNV